MGKLDKRVAIVTGGGTGIGRAIAVEFAKEGADVSICARTTPNLKKVEEEIKSLGRRCLALEADVSSKSQVNNLVKETVERFGRVDILVNNAGIIRRLSILELTDKEWKDIIDINLGGVYFCIQAVAKVMIAQEYGKIINIASICGRGGGLHAGAAYCASKAGVISLTQVAAWELGPHGINVNCIAPGLILTPMGGSDRSEEERKQFLEQQKNATVLRRIGIPENIAKTALFLASDDSSFISGQTIPVDGGRTNRM